MNDNVIVLRTPFMMAYKYTGIMPANCIMIDKDKAKEIEAKYGQDGEIIFDIDYTADESLKLRFGFNGSSNVRERRSITIRELKNLLINKKATMRYNKTTHHYGINLDRRDCKLIQ